MTPTLTALPAPPDRNTILIGDAASHLATVEEASVDMALTSPPYFRLRDYGHHAQLGLEADVDEWVAALLAVARHIARTLVPTGTLWLNLGDTYATHPSQGARVKSLLLAPERLALALTGDGWILRNKIVWAKPNPVPTSVRDRLTCSYELVFILSRQPRYHFDLDAIRQPHRSHPPLSHQRPGRQRATREAWRGPNAATHHGLDALKARGYVGHPLGKNPGDVWHFAPSRGHDRHHAAFPLALAQRAIEAGCPEARCQACRRPWTRPVIRQLGHRAIRQSLRPTCQCHAPPEPGLVLDPFLGSGTTAVAAERLRRDWLGVELNPDFAAAAAQRLQQSRDEGAAA
ncbi:site-specific DNA-methyltransferase [Rhodococcus opacus]|uniref:DNA-methyltransferase n=1 Tax=Rhodococcus opacus TaxID=37919 RepID=UPI001FF3FE29|nr:site-specific DNA-methyltransferase [Rhodococcus opacus]UOT06755.1 site-specific DNA-methyltransferase [Rhodococcus opacus]